MTFRAVRDCAGQTHGQPVIDGTTSKLNSTLQHTLLSCKTTDHCGAKCFTILLPQDVALLTDLAQPVAPQHVAPAPHCPMLQFSLLHCTVTVDLVCCEGVVSVDMICEKWLAVALTHQLKCCLDRQHPNPSYFHKFENLTTAVQ